MDSTTTKRRTEPPRSARTRNCITWGSGTQRELLEKWSHETKHDLPTEFDGHEWTVEFPVMIDRTYQMGRYGEEGVARRRRSCDKPFIDTLRQARRNYNKRSGIEKSPGCRSLR